MPHQRTRPVGWEQHDPDNLRAQTLPSASENDGQWDHTLHLHDTFFRFNRDS